MLLDIVMIYAAIGMGSLALNLCLLRQYPADLESWPHALVASVLLIAGWPYFMAHGIRTIWRRRER